MGMSIYLFAEKRKQAGWKDWDIRRYFFKRGGLILVFMLFLTTCLSALFSGGGGPEGGMNLPGQYSSGFFLPTTVLYGLGMCMLIAAFLWKKNKGWLILFLVLRFLEIGNFQLNTYTDWI